MISFVIYFFCFLFQITFLFFLSYVLSQQRMKNQRRKNQKRKNKRMRNLGHEAGGEGKQMDLKIVDENEAVEESDSSEDEVAPRNTVGNVPSEWYKDEEHIGYDITGKKIIKKEKQDKLESFVATCDDPKKYRRKIYDEYNDEEVELTKEESKLARRVQKREAPHTDFAPNVDAIHPLSSAPEPKRTCRAGTRGGGKGSYPKPKPKEVVTLSQKDTIAKKEAHAPALPAKAKKDKADSSNIDRRQ